MGKVGATNAISYWYIEEGVWWVAVSPKLAKRMCAKGHCCVIWRLEIDLYNGLGFSTISVASARVTIMSTVTMRKEAKAMIDTMSPAQLKVASEFLAFVKTRKADAATLELLAIPGFEESFARGMRDIKAGRTKPWREVRTDV